MTRLATLFIVIAASMIVEALRAGRNERAQRARGAIEPSDDVYRLMQVIYPGVFLADLVEGALHNSPPGIMIAAGVVIFAAGKALKWWAIVTLGECWTFRVLVVPGGVAVRHGPYRLLRHPNYVGVVGELAGVALIADAPIAGSLGMVVFIALMVARVRVENRALGAILPPHDRFAPRISA